MRFLLDENIDLQLRRYLRELAHDATAIARDYQHPLQDHEVLAIAHAEGRILVTNDLGFGALVFQEGLPHTGIILFRLRNEDFEIKRAWLDRVLGEHRDELHRFLVVTPRGVRAH